MKILLEAPVWYSSDKRYVSKVLDTDSTLNSEPTDITHAKQSTAPTPTAQERFLDEIAPVLFEQIKSWFSATLTVEKLRKKLVGDFIELTIASEPRWVSFVWVPIHVSIEAKAFKLLFHVLRMEERPPRIPIAFLEEDTPPTPAPAAAAAVAVPPSFAAAVSILDEIPYSTEQPLTLRDSSTQPLQWQEEQQLKRAKLRAAIARLKVEELRENYIRSYGRDEDEDEDDDEDEDEDEDEELAPKK